ncbi:MULTISPECIES: LysR family transcriptional regulator [unclassified Streptomyces]|uniref:LysR family transcriptional regulator n=1 Tax=unclassified Streptomyces TaxID=2593676 RepID=UPI000A5E36A2|nr:MULTISPECIES: LysR family transcriptional regulator [unclassified Streptomyces]
MELQHLRAFREVARELSFTRAAHNLHYSQPAVTAQIKGLEEDMGASLFQRRGNRSVELTPAGARLRPLAERILELVETAQHEIAEPPKQVQERRVVPMGGGTPMGGSAPLGAGVGVGAGVGAGPGAGSGRRFLKGQFGDTRIAGRGGRS